MIVYTFVRDTRGGRGECGGLGGGVGEEGVGGEEGRAVDYLCKSLLHAK